MASVSSLDKDLRKVRLDKFTPAAANEARAWIEEILGERLPSSDLLEALRDGIALCKLVNLALPPPGVKFKQSAMPFVQMENISIFLRACQAPPLNLHQHDTFLTVDLYEQKDPAQVLQCLGAFSRAANAASPANFPRVIGPKTRGGGVVSPQGTGPPSTPPASSRDRGISVTSNSSSNFGGVFSHRTGDSGRYSPTKGSPARGPGSPGPVTSWSRKEHESASSPAWNIAQYGYMGGASQGNLGIAFGARRQITNAGPKVPSLAEKERMRKEKEAEEERLRQEAEEDERRAQLEEAKRWEEEEQRQREEERRKAEEEKKRWEEEERQWKLTEEKRRQEEEEAEVRMEEERRRARSRSENRLKGQFLSQYQAEQKASEPPAEGEYSSRVRELERELELARQREAEYQRERKGKLGRQESEAEIKPKQDPRIKQAQIPTRQDSWSRDEREFLRTKWNQHQEAPEPKPSTPEPASAPISKPVTSPRPLPEPTAVPRTKSPSRPLPDPSAYSSTPPAPQNRTDRFLAGKAPPPLAPKPQQTYSRELGLTQEQDSEDRRRVQSQEKTKAGGWASKSLLEREMEMERQRQKEWEESQKETAAAVRSGNGVDGIGGGIGGKWDVGQWAGFTGGDGQNKGSQGIGAGRRQIVGPRPLPGPK
ncbi:unnamed protein product [Clonostachys chloroleuca]|uniref:Calponin-homology (CH) domain-containing protein n=1 Tax=Clonostachys chloroleuca TaxID=1926264 RepID=A0AA35M287_9HYPO|nr:unnamed protein product [Clonostachys chloroleuca]